MAGNGQPHHPPRERGWETLAAKMVDAASANGIAEAEGIGE